MQTQTLSKQQQRSTLASKNNKKKPEARIRNVYAQPYKPYWPILPQGCENELESLLEKALRPARKDRPKSLQAGEHLKEESRLSVEKSEKQKKLWSFIVRGINEVSRGLENGIVGCVLLSEDVNPRQIVSHIPQMCAISGVPVLVLQYLRDVTKRALDFSCAALGFKKEAVTDMENHFYLVCVKIQVLTENLPPPVPHVPLFNINSEAENNSQSSMEQELKISEVKDHTNLHLYRASRKERTFVPNSNYVPKSSMDFIPLGFNDLTTIKTDNGLKDKNQGKVHYQALKVKRIQPNPRKLKRLRAK